ncbi:transcriptional regulator [Streptomyces lushanensis]|uniref:transcriptional regulator n=1 Tax=Streptomyces lushanensis TaxID=1434255 RepID=UPI000832D848|nr:transcriptional regulator [Streptomyces lushanensis]
MSAQQPNARLARLLEEAGWNAAQLAHAISSVASEHGHDLAVNRSTVTRWLAGTRPRPPAPAYILEALARRLRRPLAADDAGLTRAPTRIPDWSWEADPVHHLARLTNSQLDPGRGKPLGVAVYSLAALTVPNWEDLLSRTTARRAGLVAGRRVGRAEVEALQSMTAFFATSTGAFGGGHARTALTTYLADDVTPWLLADAGEQVHRQLLTQAAQLTVLLGNMCADDGADALAQHYHRTAAHLAAEAEDPHTYTIALRALASHALELGHRQPALTLTEQAAATAARHSSPLTQSFIQSQLALAHARAQDRPRALLALQTAEVLHSRADQDPSDPFGSYPTAALHYQRARTLTALRDHQAADRAFNASLRARAPQARRARALTTALLAESQLLQGNLEESIATWRRFLSDYPGLRSARATDSLTTMRQVLRPYSTHPGVALLTEEAASL